MAIAMDMPKGRLCITDTILRIGLETRNHEHIRQIRQALTAAGFKIMNN